MKLINILKKSVENENLKRLDWKIFIISTLIFSLIFISLAINYNYLSKINNELSFRTYLKSPD
ncbi:MAG: hypothetical protein ACOC56_02805, partial [Atribacterota bacterium]